MKTLLIVSASRRKKSKACPAREMYEGPLFRMVRRSCEARGYDYVIISPKYGLLFPEEIVEPHSDVNLMDEKVFGSLQEKVLYRLKEILPKYDKVIVVAGARYRELLKPIWDDRFTYIKASGYGDMVRKVKELI